MFLDGFAVHRRYVGSHLRNQCMDTVDSLLVGYVTRHARVSGDPIVEFFAFFTHGSSRESRPGSTQHSQSPKSADKYDADEKTIDTSVGFAHKELGPKASSLCLVSTSAGRSVLIADRDPALSLTKRGGVTERWDHRAGYHREVSVCVSSSIGSPSSAN